MLKRIALWELMRLMMFVFKCSWNSLEGRNYSLMIRVDDHIIMRMNMMQAQLVYSIMINHHIIIWTNMEIDALVIIVIIIISMRSMIIHRLIMMWIVAMTKLGERWSRYC